MPEIVKPYVDDEVCKTVERVLLAHGSGEARAIVVVLLRKEGPFEVAAYVDAVDRDRLRGAVLELAGALAAAD